MGQRMVCVESSEAGQVGCLASKASQKQPIDEHASRYNTRSHHISDRVNPARASESRYICAMVSNLQKGKI